MSTVIVVGHVNHDQVWSLSAPLASGSRLTYSDRVVRLGGGGFHTGTQLAKLGNDVRLISNLMDDDHGRAALAKLQASGIDTGYVTMWTGETRFTEILLEPNGERTILNPGGQLRPPFAAPEPVSGDAAYLNALVLDDGLVASLRTIPLVISQFPLRSPSHRPADIVIGSRADFPGEDVQGIWERASRIAGPRLRTLVLTDGMRPISLYDGKALNHVTPLKQVSVPDTIGAGDCFTGIFLHGLLQGLIPELSAEQASQQTAEWLSERSRTG
ncbi:MULTISPECIES: carbohydrate kinase family protein [Mesorhizobium]|nr:MULTISPECIES: PfkB family carbohydrate kinase [Mesorhizobium]MBE1710948.1 carbohydrate kinase [Mesorhizobium japonicum]MBE1715384.1 carbohydrate kinase [Mesorhizobium japonicum]OBP78881.1 carbohydrate kinase [Mesorhizobium loti]OBP80119.1 carbohydrate kinase [Mesorhizobium loti]OBP84539.1 carbohydrate kinase [Mesorhizobium loti]